MLLKYELENLHIAKSVDLCMKEMSLILKYLKLSEQDATERIYENSHYVTDLEREIEELNETVDAQTKDIQRSVRRRIASMGGHFVLECTNMEAGQPVLRGFRTSSQALKCSTPE